MVTLAIVLALSPAAGVTAQINRNIEAFAYRDYQTMWASYTPRYKIVCNQAKWLATVKATRATYQEATPTAARIRVRVRGRYAVASYRLIYNGQTVAKVAGDVYENVGGRWLDDLDTVTACTF
ncbi:MAG: hypothetical protein NUW01_09420 [Gemmatimonadaceae bacterium]|nr:hypothetical protein [Gemmatimonadaceae bacterium]